MRRWILSAVPILSQKDWFLRTIWQSNGIRSVPNLLRMCRETNVPRNEHAEDSIRPSKIVMVVKRILAIWIGLYWLRRRPGIGSLWLCYLPSVPPTGSTQCQMNFYAPNWNSPSSCVWRFLIWFLLHLGMAFDLVADQICRWSVEASCLAEMLCVISLVTAPVLRALDVAFEHFACLVEDWCRFSHLFITNHGKIGMLLEELYRQTCKNSLVL